MPVIRPEGLGAAAMVVWLASASLFGESVPPARKSRSDAITPLLDKRLKAGANLDDVSVDIRWPLESRHVVCRVYGDGVGIWDRQIQFRLSQSEAASLFQAVARAGFGALPDTVGGEPKE